MSIWRRLGFLTRRESSSRSTRDIHSSTRVTNSIGLIDSLAHFGINSEEAQGFLSPDGTVSTDTVRTLIWLSESVEGDAEDPEQALRILEVAIETAMAIDDELGMALSLAASGRILAHSGSPNQAIHSLNRCRDILSNLGDSGEHVTILGSVGLCMFSLGRGAIALQCYEEILQRVLRPGHEISRFYFAQLHCWLGQLYHDQQDFSKAVEHQKKSLALFAAERDEARVAKCLTHLATNYIVTNELDKVPECLIESLHIYERLGYKLEISLVWQLWGTLHGWREDYVSALECFRRAYQWSTEAGVQEPPPEFLIKLASLWMMRGNSHFARALYEAAHSILDRDHRSRVHDLDTRRHVLAGLKGVLWLQRDFSGLLNRMNKELEQAETSNSGSDVTRTIIELGNVHSALWDLPRAKHYYDKAGDADLTDPFVIYSYHLGLGNYYLKLNETSPALEHLAKAVVATQHCAGRCKKNTALVLISISEGKERVGQYGEALAYCHDALSIAREIGDRILLQSVFHRLGRIFEDCGELTQAVDAFRAGVELAETLRAGLPVPESPDRSPLYFLDGVVSSYLSLAVDLCALGRPLEALRYAEASRARIMLDSLEHRRNVSPPSAMPFDPAYLEPASWHPLNDSSNLAVYDRAPDVELSENTIYVEYVVTRRQLIIIVLMPSDGGVGHVCRAHTVDIPSQELKEFVERFRRTLSQGLGGFKSNAQELYGILLSPLRKDLIPGRRLCFIPDHALWNMPFQALMPDSHSYLIDEHVISLAPSLAMLKTLKRLHDASASQESLLILGAMEERCQTSGTTVTRTGSDAASHLGRIVKLYKGIGHRLLEDASANRSSVLEAMRSHRLIQFIGHCVLDETDVLGSYLQLLPSGSVPDGAPEETRISARDILEIKMWADLVVLCGCDTGRGKWSSEGLIGLSWAFLIAGCQSLVLSQWAVRHDSALLLTDRLHRNLIERSACAPGLSDKAAALRSACLSTRSEPGFAHPLHWAPFVLIGDPGSPS